MGVAEVVVTAVISLLVGVVGFLLALLTQRVIPRQESPGQPRADTEQAKAAAKAEAEAEVVREQVDEEVRTGDLDALADRVNRVE